jgi:predicted GNAT family acetyltransferase
MANSVRDNTDKRRFELDTEGHIAFSEYKSDGGVLTVMHTEVPKELGGKGVGSELVRGILDIARAQKMKVVARCPFVAGYIDKHPEYQDLRK